MRIVKRLFYYITLLVAVLLTACSSDETTNNEQPLPEGMGRIRVTICTPENIGGDSQSSLTRAVNAIPWEDPDHEWEMLQTFKVLICKSSETETGKYEVVQVISGTKDQFTVEEHDPADSESTSMESTHKTATVYSDPLTADSYYLFATANFNAEDDYAVGDIVDPNEIVKFSNSSCYYIVGGAETDALYDVDNIPMTGRLSTAVEVVNGAESEATITLWRVLAKMQFEFTNESDKDIKILGIEVDPINRATASTNPGIYLFSKDNLESTANLAPVTGITLPDAAKADTGAVAFIPPIVNEVSQPLTLAAKNSGNTDEGKIYFYLNESNGTFTTTRNQLSLRFKVQRKKNENEWYEEEIRYGVTTHYGNGSDGQNGFNVIRRNDWIHIPIILTDWQLRIEPLAFVPIAGYPATTVGNDGLTTTFSTGGMIALQPFVKKYSDATWRDFNDSEVTLVSVHWKNADGTNVYGSTEIVKSQFVYDENSKCLIGELNQDLVGSNYMTTFTVDVILGPTDDNDDTNNYDYSFTFNVILQ